MKHQNNGIQYLKLISILILIRCPENKSNKSPSCPIYISKYRGLHVRLKHFFRHESFVMTVCDLKSVKRLKANGLMVWTSNFEELTSQVWLKVYDPNGPDFVCVLTWNYLEYISQEWLVWKRVPWKSAIF